MISRPLTADYADTTDKKRRIIHERTQKKMQVWDPFLKSLDFDALKAHLHRSQGQRPWN